jgi:hypothetical protein
LLVIIGVSILLWGISAMICGAIGESKIKNWKEEHPNDQKEIKKASIAESKKRYEEYLAEQKKSAPQN